MRTTYNRQLDELRIELGRLCELAGWAARRATEAVLAANTDAAHDALAVVAQMRSLSTEAERQAVSILALQAPVASDLRAVFSGIRIASGAERMGGLAAHVAELALRRHPDAVVPDDMRDLFAGMGRHAVGIAMQCRDAVLDKDGARAARVAAESASMEELHRSVFLTVQSPRWAHDTAVAIDVALLGRYYGRFADQACEIANRIAFEAGGDHGAAAS